MQTPGARDRVPERSRPPRDPGSRAGGEGFDDGFDGGFGDGFDDGPGDGLGPGPATPDDHARRMLHPDRRADLRNPASDLDRLAGGPRHPASDPDRRAEGSRPGGHGGSGGESAPAAPLRRAPVDADAVRDGFQLVRDYVGDANRSQDQREYTLEPGAQLIRDYVGDAGRNQDGVRGYVTESGGRPGRGYTGAHGRRPGPDFQRYDQRDDRRQEPRDAGDRRAPRPGRRGVSGDAQTADAAMGSDFPAAFDPAFGSGLDAGFDPGFDPGFDAGFDTDFRAGFDPATDTGSYADADLPEPEAAEQVPVFVDATGHRRKMARRISIGAVGLLAGYGGLVAVSFAGGPIPPGALLPVPGLPTAKAPASQGAVHGAATHGAAPHAATGAHDDRQGGTTAAPGGGPAGGASGATTPAVKQTPAPLPSGTASASTLPTTAPSKNGNGNASNTHKHSRPSP